MKSKQGMSNHVFEIEKIINNQDEEDAWIVYHSEKEIEQFRSLNDLLWNIEFNPEKQ